MTSLGSRNAATYGSTLQIVGVDDWPFRRIYRYSKTAYDIERWLIETLSPDHETATAEA